ncbi:MAG: TetR/AcrR family transcriptional regulator [Bacteroidetes bacterium]|nr:TetR/AcrR family transcriptional regulator [Bacteroidota bacterium]
MTPRTHEQFQNIRLDKKTLIMTTALELFANTGYHSTSISDIARNAGISKGLMYNYFISKESLITEILAQGIDSMAEFFDPNNDGVLTDEEMKSFIRNIFEFLKKDKQYWKLYYAVFSQPQVYELIEKKYINLLSGFIEILTNYFKAHGAKDPTKEALLFGALMDGVGLNYVMSPDLYPIDNLVELILEKFCYIKKY